MGHFLFQDYSSAQKFSNRTLYRLGGTSRPHLLNICPPACFSFLIRCNLRV